PIFNTSGSTKSNTYRRGRETKWDETEDVAGSDPPAAGKYSRSRPYCRPPFADRSEKRRRRRTSPSSAMASHVKDYGQAFVIMGVSGTGKSTVAEMLAKALDCSFLEADDFHSQANKDKMRKGVPLTDEDRFPWLEVLRDAVGKIMSSSKNVTLTCSALQKKYREILRSADADYKPGQYTICRVKFICLEASVEVIADRIRRRSKDGKHFMPVSLLQSQLDLLQIDEAEGVIRVDATMSREAILDSILTSHF
ncbi:unnamed protein product, partial [Musa hybrid cultivar]